MGGARFSKQLGAKCSPCPVTSCVALPDLSRLCGLRACSRSTTKHRTTRLKARARASSYVLVRFRWCSISRRGSGWVMPRCGCASARSCSGTFRRRRPKTGSGEGTSFSFGCSSYLHSWVIPYICFSDLGRGNSPRPSHPRLYCG